MTTEGTTMSRIRLLLLVSEKEESASLRSRARGVVAHPLEASGEVEAVGAAEVTELLELGAGVVDDEIDVRVEVALGVSPLRLDTTDAASVKADWTDARRDGLAAFRIDARLAIRDAADRLADSEDETEEAARREETRDAAAAELDELEEARALARDADDCAGLREVADTAALGRMRGGWRKVLEVAAAVGDATAKTRGATLGSARRSRRKGALS